MNYSVTTLLAYFLIVGTIKLWHFYNSLWDIDNQNITITNKYPVAIFKAFERIWNDLKNNKVSKLITFNTIVLKRKKSFKIALLVISTIGRLPKNESRWKEKSITNGKCVYFLLKKAVVTILISVFLALQK
jgi:hypothetical protein